MATTRAQASQLLTKAELELFDAGAASNARHLDAATLRSRIARARELRDKARDRLKRQRLASRDRSGSKLGRSGTANARTLEKAELLAEVLERLHAQRARLKPVAGAAGRKAAAKKSAAKKALPSNTVAKKAPAQKVVAKKIAAKKIAAKKVAARKGAAKQPTATKSARKKTTAKKAAVKTAGKLAATVHAALPADSFTDAATALDSPQTFMAPERSAKAPVPLEPPGTSRTAVANTGYVNEHARSAAQERHFGEIRGRAIQGHISATGRRNQGKRDNRGKD